MTSGGGGVLLECGAMKRGSLSECARIAWPLVLAMTGNALMLFVDRMFLSRYGAASIQAALPAGLVAFMVVALLQNVVAYSGTFVAQYSGAGARAACARAAGQGLWLALLCVPLLLLSVPVGFWLFDWVGHAPEVLAEEKRYYLTLAFANMALPFGAALSGFFAGRGRTRLVMAANLAGNAANIVLDPLLIWGWGPVPEMGIAGAGVATAVGQWLIALILAAATLREPHFATRRRRNVALAWKTPLALRIVRFGVPNGGHVLLDVGTFTVFTFVTGWLPQLEFAASNIAFAINQLVFAPLMGIGMAAGIVVGQRMGEGDAEGAARGGRNALLLGWLYVLLCVAVIGGLHGPILRLFYPAHAPFDYAAYHALGRTLIAIFLAWAFFDVLNIVLGGALKGAGDTRFVVWWVGGVAVLLWMPALFLCYWLGCHVAVLWLTMLGYVMVAGGGLLARFLLGRWKALRLLEGR